MLSRASLWVWLGVQENPRDVVVMLVGADHIKYGMGAPSRLERLLTALDVRLPKGRGACVITLTRFQLAVG